MSMFDDVVLGEVETAIKMEDIFDDIKTSNPEEYEGNNYYFSCGVIHPSFALFVPVVPKQEVIDNIKLLRSEKDSSDIEVRNKAMNACIMTIMGTSATFQKYTGKGGARLLEKYSKQGKPEYREFCNDVVLYNIYMNVFFHKNISLWDVEQIKQMGLYRE